jgi:hypothetical protein
MKPVFDAMEAAGLLDNSWPPKDAPATRQPLPDADLDRAWFSAADFGITTPAPAPQPVELGTSPKPDGTSIEIDGTSVKKRQPRSKYEENSLSARKPWEAEGISRRTWYRRQDNS